MQLTHILQSLRNFICRAVFQGWYVLNVNNYVHDWWAYNFLVQIKQLQHVYVMVCRHYMNSLYTSSRPFHIRWLWALYEVNPEICASFGSAKVVFMCKLCSLSAVTVLNTKEKSMKTSENYCPSKDYIHWFLSFIFIHYFIIYYYCRTLTSIMPVLFN